MNAERDAPWTVQRLLEWTRDYLDRQGIESPRLCAEILLADAMGCQRIHLYTRFEEVPEESVRTAFRDHVRRAADGMPIAYLTGVKEFFSLPFRVSPDVLIPRPETEILVERTIDLVRKSEGSLRRVVDIGTGSGCIAVSLAKHLPEVELVATDVSDAALAVARGNAEQHGVLDRVTFLVGDLFAPLDASGLFDIIVANPPYVATQGAPVDPHVRTYEPSLAVFAGDDGLDVIRDLVGSAPKWLRPGGHLLLEVAFDQASIVRDLLAERALQDIVSYRDGAGYERVLHARRSAESSQVA